MRERWTLRSGLRFWPGGTVSDDQAGTAPLAHSGSEVELVANNHSARLPHDESRQVYLEVLLDGELVDCLQDTGSEATFLSGYLVQKLPMRPIRSQIRADNGTLIDALWLVELTLVVEGRKMTIRGVASDHIGEMLLGIDWLKQQEAVWDMCRGELNMHGTVYPLKTKTSGGWVRRVLLQEPVRLPARIAAK